MEEAAILAFRKLSEPTLVTDPPVDGHAQETKGQPLFQFAAHPLGPDDLDLAQTAELFSDQQSILWQRRWSWLIFDRANELCPTFDVRFANKAQPDRHQSVKKTSGKLPTEVALGNEPQF